MLVANYCIEVYIQVSNFPFAWWDKTITIYNKLVDPTTQRVSWYRTVVKNCFWKCVNNTYIIGRAGVSSTGIQLDTKDIVCRIPQDKRFVEKREWKALADKSNRFTLANGDIIVLGEVDDVIDEYVSGKHSTDLITKYKEFDACLQIETYVNNVQTGVGLAHYRIVGK